MKCSQILFVKMPWQLWIHLLGMIIFFFTEITLRVQLLLTVCIGKGNERDDSKIVRWVEVMEAGQPNCLWTSTFRLTFSPPHNNLWQRLITLPHFNTCPCKGFTPHYTRTYVSIWTLATSRSSKAEYLQLTRVGTFKFFARFYGTDEGFALNIKFTNV